MARSRVSEWLPTASPKTTAAATGASPRSARSRRGSSSTSAARRRSVPADQQPSRIATSARWSECASACVPIAQAFGVSAIASPAATPSARAGQGADQVHRDPGRDGHADGREQVHPEGRFAERLEHDRGEPAEQDVGREAGRVGGAHQRRDRLELGRVPERDTGLQRQRGGRRSAIRPTPTGGARRVRSRGHHPSRRPHATPHRLIASDDDDEASSREHAASAAAPAARSRARRG